MDSDYELAKGPESKMVKQPSITYKLLGTWAEPKLVVKKSVEATVST